MVLGQIGGREHTHQLLAPHHGQVVDILARHLQLRLEGVVFNVDGGRVAGHRQFQPKGIGTEKGSGMYGRS